MARILEVIHLSDLHFGPKNIGRAVGPEDSKSIAELLLRDLKGEAESLPQVHADRVSHDRLNYQQVVCITGDFTASGSALQFGEAAQFLEELRVGFGWTIDEARKRILLIPGNHDLEWKQPSASLRWQNWRHFWTGFYGGNLPSPNDPLAWVKVQTIPEAGALVACFDSEHHIHSTSEYRQCGFISDEQLSHVETLLEDLARTPDFDDLIKIAIVHHHPVLIPSFVEAGKGVHTAAPTDDPGYDAIVNSQLMMNLLHRFGFHLVMHGHKHIPHVFSEDIANACHKTKDHSMVIVAAGTVSSDDQISMAGWSQSYNRIRLHWNSDRNSTRVQVTTRGLVKFTRENVPIPWKKYKWDTLRTVERFSSPWLTIPDPILSDEAFKLPYASSTKQEKARIREYTRLRGNMPATETRPSLVPGQSYEVKFWITRHNLNEQESPESIPTKVIWSAGRKFPRYEIHRDVDMRFCGIFHCYGPMLLQAEMFFSDNTSQIAHIYANFPEIVTPAQS